MSGALYLHLSGSDLQAAFSGLSLSSSSNAKNSAHTSKEGQSEEPKILRLGISFDNDTRASRKLIGRITTKSFFMKMS